MRWLIGLVGLLAIGSLSQLGIASAGTPITRKIAPNTIIDWDAAKVLRRFQAAETIVTVESADPRCPDSCEDAFPVFTVSAAGRAPLRIKHEGSEPQGRIGIGILNKGQLPSVVIASWTGGAHCCAHVQVAMPMGAGFRAVDLGLWDGDQIAWPRDRDGDGSADFVFVDNAFLYTFDSYAGSWAPPLIMTIRSGRAVNVSREPAFRPLFVADYTKARKACLSSAAYAARGACAGYLADAARLGRFAQAKAEVSRLFAKDDPDFVASVAAFLREHGYLR